MTISDSNKSKEDVSHVYVTTGSEDNYIYSRWNCVPLLNDKAAWKNVS